MLRKLCARGREAARGYMQVRAFSESGGTGGVAGAKIVGVARFYDQVGVKRVEQDASVGYGVTVDGKIVKTPQRTPLVVPLESMAWAIAQEWDAQRERIKPATMPLTSLASTALDLEKTSSVEALVNEIVHYVHSDTLCYEVAEEKQEKLLVVQRKKWAPIRTWFAEQFDTKIDVLHGPIERLSHDASIEDRIRATLTQCTVMELVALRSMTRETKSFIAAWALFKRRITAKEAMDASRVEEEFQIGGWGLVEGGHDLDRVNCSTGLASASFLLWLVQNHKLDTTTSTYTDSSSIRPRQRTPHHRKHRTHHANAVEQEQVSGAS